MSEDHGELIFFGHREVDRLAQLVFDLAAQLHIERQRRLGLETLLMRSGAIKPADLEALAEDRDFLAAARAQLDESQKRLLNILMEGGDRLKPLRDETKSRRE